MFSFVLNFVLTQVKFMHLFKGQWNSSYKLLGFFSTSQGGTLSWQQSLEIIPFLFTGVIVYLTSFITPLLDMLLSIYLVEPVSLHWNRTLWLVHSNSKATWQWLVQCGTKEWLHHLHHSLVSMTVCCRVHSFTDWCWSHCWCYWWCNLFHGPSWCHTACLTLTGSQAENPGSAGGRPHRLRGTRAHCCWEVN